MRHDLLTEREREVFGYLAKGNTSKQIAEGLSISVHTVNNHRKRICRKLAVHSTAELISVAARHSLTAQGTEGGPVEHAASQTAALQSIV
jgi:DNA-binding CsgD family transcriptional regulator